MDEESSHSSLSSQSSSSSSTDQVSSDGNPSVANNKDKPVMDSTKEGEEEIAENSSADEPDGGSLQHSSSATSETSRAVSPTSTDDDVNEDDVETGQISQSSGFFESSMPNVDSSLMSAASGDDDVSDVCSSIAESENADSAPVGSTTSKSSKRKRSRQPSIMIGYKKRRKTQHSAARKQDEEFVAAAASVMTRSTNGAENGSSAGVACPERDKSEPHQSSSEELSESLVTSTRNSRKYSSVAKEVTKADRFCWICHKEGGFLLKCIACPRVYHSKCHLGPNYDPANFHCPECSAVLKADNVNTRSPVLVTVDLEQLCVLLKHIITVLRAQNNSHFFDKPVDTADFPDYREYVVYPMDLSLLERNIKNKVYGCTEAFLADVKWIVHNSIVFNSRAAKITNIAKNLLKICQREILEIETCAECYYKFLVRNDTWFLEVCRKPHLLVWARLKGYPHWPAKAMYCKDGLVDCRFFPSNEKAWVPVKDCLLYSQVHPTQKQARVKKVHNLEYAIKKIEEHIEKLQEKFGPFLYPATNIPYSPAKELEHLRMMLPNYNPGGSVRQVRVDRILQPKTLFGDGDEKSGKEEDEPRADDENKRPSWTDGETMEKMEKRAEWPQRDMAAEESSSDFESETETAAHCDVKAETPCSSPTKTTSESSTPPRVSVKNIESINASVPNTPNASPRAQAPEVTSGGTKVDDAKAAAANCKSVVTSVALPKTETDCSSSEEFDLSKVKDEPIECDELEDVSSSLVPDVAALAPSAMLAPAAVQKRALELLEQPVKKVKVDAKCRTVNITENVTLSLINQSPDPKPRPVVKKVTKAVPMAVPLVIPAAVVTATVAQPTSRVVYANSSLNDIRSKVMSPTVLPNGSIVSRPNTKVQARVVNNVMQTNGLLCVSTRPAVTVVPSRSSTNASDSFNDFFNKVMNESLTECHSTFRRIFESALDKLAGKGDPKGRLVALKKEMEVMKRNHDVFIDEMRRDYEVQIAELRATSVAKTQFDLAAERLKCEQEKERAVKEAKSKQWCSNCQKIANYYCCWNTAYCDFECQKEHWIQHVHVCKNDVKKKTTESSENEPPRIMMQSEISNGYLANGYDKSSSSFSYSNVGTAVVASSMPRTLNRPRTNVSTAIRDRLQPLTMMPRTVSVSRPSTSNSTSTNLVVVHSKFQNARPV